ncbi:MAG TPA: methionyl-tRNA formyltransferase [Burkholderiales bacterium]|nr:methionyl-tRNA formyltransferase [Burkholderiales bacterium]
MRLVFAGTPDFAVPALEAVVAAGHHVAAVLTQPDRPAGRGLAEVASPVKQAAARRGIPVLQPATLKAPAAQDALRALAPDALVVAAYGLILPQAVLDIPRLGAINIHGSLLPRWRGAAPIQRALLAGDRETGISIMQMDAGLDTGAVLLREALPIRPEDTAGTLHDRLAALGARLVVAALDGLARGTLVAAPQPLDGVTYAAKLEKAEARIDWTHPAVAIERQVRAFNPVPGATARVRGTEVKVWQAAPAGGTGEPGAVIAIDPQGIVVGTGSGALRLEALQRAGGKRLSAGNFLRGFPLAIGERFTTPATN